MKKLFKISSMLFITSIVSILMSCGSDSSNEGSSVLSGDELIKKAVGVWMCTQSTDSYKGETYQGLFVGKEIAIYSNGTYTSTAQSFGYSGRFTIDGNNITAYSDSGATFLITVTFSGSNMNWQGTSNNGVSFNYVFKRESSDVPTVYKFTKELLVGNAEYDCWETKSINIERGKSSSLKVNKLLTFKEDGTCTAFHSMETAWRINGGRVETYYSKTNEPIYVYTLLSDNGKDINVRVNGTLDDDLQATIVLSRKKNELTNTTTEYDLEAFYNGIYSAFAKFIETQLRLESIRTNPQTVHNISPSSSEISQAFQAAYKVINYADIYITNTASIGSVAGFDLDKSIAEVRALKAFTYYNIAMLWGNSPFNASPVTNAADVTYSYPQTDLYSIYSFAYTEICEVLEKLPKAENNSNSKMHFNQDVGLILKAILELAQGNNSKARSILDGINKTHYGYETSSSTPTLEKQTIFQVKVSTTGGTIPVYTYTHQQLLCYEITGNKKGLIFENAEGSTGNESGSKDDVILEWQRQSNVDYGYWAMLKRLRKAQEITGCTDNELLMPFPSSEILYNPKLIQNPGY